MLDLDSCLVIADGTYLPGQVAIPVVSLPYSAGGLRVCGAVQTQGYLEEREQRHFAFHVPTPDPVSYKCQARQDLPPAACLGQTVSPVTQLEVDEQLSLQSPLLLFH